MEFDATLWSGLPDEIVERVLSYLPVPNLCRYRTVCKRWNSLICSPPFGTLHLQNANADSYYIGGRYCGLDSEDDDGDDADAYADDDDGGSRREVGWCILDLNARRWYTCKRDPMDGFDILNPLTMDGGLICEHLEGCEITVSNPLSSTTKVLPIPPCHWTSELDPHVNFLVDSVSNTYKIFIINRAFLKMVPEDPIMYVFESTTEQWRSLANPPAILDVGEEQGNVGVRVSSVMFQGLLYVLFESYNNVPQYWLFRYDALEDTWTETGIDIIEAGNTRHNDILVESGDRLFLVRSSFSDLSGTFGILELLVGKRECKVLVQSMPRMLFLQGPVLEKDLNSNLFIEAFGFGTSIMLVSSETLLSIAYNLESCSFELLPPNPVDRLHFEFQFFGGKPMRQLRLPSSLF